MNKLTPLVVLTACLVLVAGGGAAVWLVRDRLADAPKADPRRADYDLLVARQGGDEWAVRDELNDLVRTSSAPMDEADRPLADALPAQCMCPTALLDLAHVRAFCARAGRGENVAYHFVGPAHKTRLVAIAGEDPPPERVVAIRRALTELATEFARIREAPDWTATVEGGEPPALRFLDLLRDAHEFLPPSQHPELRTNPRLPAFASADGELLVHLERFFNGPKARAAFPAAKYPKMYQNDRIPPIPTALFDYRAEIGETVLEEKATLLPPENADAEGAAAVNDTYAKLEQFFSAVVSFDRKD